MKYLHETRMTIPNEGNHGYSTWRLLCSVFLILTCFKGLNVLPKDNYTGVCGYIWALLYLKLGAYAQGGGRLPIRVVRNAIGPNRH